MTSGTMTEQPVDTTGVPHDDRFGVSESLRSHYGQYYSEGASEWRDACAVAKAKNIVTLCRDHPHRTVLEIGAGDGAILGALHDVGFGSEFYALEISNTAVDTIQERDLPLLRECWMFDGYTCPYPDESFDLVILSHVLEHVEYPRRLITEAKRVARLVFVEVPLELNFRTKEDFVLDSLGHINDFSRKTIRRLLQSCGLEVLGQLVVNPPRRSYVLQRGPIGNVAFWIKELALEIAPPFAPWFWTYHSALACRSL